MKKSSTRPNVGKTRIQKAIFTGKGRVKLSWKIAKGAKKYEVYRAANKNGKYTKIKVISKRKCTDRKLTAGRTYYYKVRAYKMVNKKEVVFLMKKYIAFALVILLVSLLPVNNKTVAVTPYPSAHYNTFEELINDIPNSFGLESWINVYGDAFKQFVDGRKAQKGLYVPFFNDTPITLRNQDGYHNIWVSPEGLYGRPWVWFYARFEESNIAINTMYLDYLGSDTIKEANEKGCPWFINQLSPNTYKVDDVQNYEKEIKLKNRTVKAFVNEDDERGIDIFFVYDDLLVHIMSLPRLPLPEWFERLSFEPIYAKPLKVTFKNASKKLTIKSVPFGKKVKSYTPKKKGYIFIGWYADKKYKTKFDFSKSISKDTTVYARFNKTPSKPNVKVKTIKSRQVNLSWKKQKGWTYVVQMSTSRKASTFSTIKTTTAASVTRKELKKGQTYYFRVRRKKKVDGVAVKSEWSAIRKATG